MTDKTFPASRFIEDGTTMETLAETLFDTMDGDGKFRDSGDGADISHDNMRRAGFAAVALAAYGDRTRGGDEEAATVLSDLLCDVRHLCDAPGEDFDALLSIGRMHYVAELRGEL